MKKAAESLSLFEINLSNYLCVTTAELSEKAERDVFQRAMKDTFPLTKTKNDTEYNAQTFDLDERESELDCAQTGDENEPREKESKLVDPQKRADIRFARGENLLQHKRRSSRRKRVDASRSVPPLMRRTKQIGNLNPKKSDQQDMRVRSVISSKFRIMRKF